MEEHSGQGRCSSSLAAPETVKSSVKFKQLTFTLDLSDFFFNTETSDFVTIQSTLKFILNFLSKGIFHNNLESLCHFIDIYRNTCKYGFIICDSVHL